MNHGIRYSAVVIVWVLVTGACYEAKNEDGQDAGPPDLPRGQESHDTRARRELGQERQVDLVPAVDLGQQDFGNTPVLDQVTITYTNAP